MKKLCRSVFTLDWFFLPAILGDVREIGCLGTKGLNMLFGRENTIKEIKRIERFDPVRPDIGENG